MLVEIAVTLFQQDRLTLGQTAAFAGLTQLDMQRTLAARKIPLHHGVEDLEHNLATAKKRCKDDCCFTELRQRLDGTIERAGFWIGNDLGARFLLGVEERP